MEEYFLHGCFSRFLIGQIVPNRPKYLIYFDMHPLITPETHENNRNDNEKRQPPK